MEIDNSHTELGAAVASIREELARLPTTPLASPREGYVAILSEVDKMWAELQQDRKLFLRPAARKIAAAAIRFMLDCTPTPEDPA